MTDINRLLDYDPLTKEACWFTGHADGTFSVTHTQPDMDTIIEGNKTHANQVARNKGIKENWWKYATVPNTILMQWSKEVGGDILQRKYQKEFFKRLNHPDHQYLKVTHGRHDVKN